MLKIFLSAALAALLAGSAGATTVLNANSALVAGNATLSSVTVGGRVMVGGDASFNGGSDIGGSLDASANGSTVVGIAGNMNYVNSTVRYGNVVYGGTNQSDPYNVVATPNGSVAQGAVNVAGAFADATSLSGYLGGRAATGTLAALYGVGTLNGTAEVNVYNLTVADLNALYKLVVSGSGSTIINVTGGSYDHYLAFETSGIAASDILFNFVDATSVSLGGTNLPASVLATGATVSTNGTIQGSVVSGALSGGGASIAGNGYAGSLAGYGAQPAQGTPSAVPEPASWLLLIAGFGMVGWVVRRNRHSFPAFLR